MAIEADRQIIDGLPVSAGLLASLRESSRLASTHFSTQIEGNRLTQDQVQSVLAGGRMPGRERDSSEVRNYYRAIETADTLARASQRPTEIGIRRIHGLVIGGRNKPTPYRSGQNVIRDSVTGEIVYMPPEPADVPVLMRDLFRWLTDQMQEPATPAPIIAALAHYQFATAHPYYDGNGRTARLLASVILDQTGYGLNGIYNLEEYYAQDLDRYYRALAVGPSHNYYLGRAEADLSDFVEYFCIGMAQALAAVRVHAARAAESRGSSPPDLSQLSPRERSLAALLGKEPTLTAARIALHLALSERTVATLCRSWVKSGLLNLHDPSRKARSYRAGPRLAGHPRSGGTGDSLSRRTP